MSEVSIITNDEIMEMTQLVFDRYYTELKRQLRRGEIPAEKTEEYCTEILYKVYQALQTQSVAATSYEMDACAIPIINEEIRRILVPLHLNGYRNLRENPVTESQKETEATLQEEQVVESENTDAEQKETYENHDVAEIKANTVPVVSNGDVQVYPETAENELNPELRMEIRRILQQEFQLEPAQVKPVVVVVNVTAPQSAEPVRTQTTEPASTDAVRSLSEEPMQEEPVQEETVSAVQMEEVSTVQMEEVSAVQEVKAAEEPIGVEEEQIPIEIIRTEPVLTAEKEAEAAREATSPETEAEPLPELDLDLEKLIQESEASAATDEKKEKNHLWLWVPIILLLMILLWLTVGMLMSYGIVPELDLGYEWFNETIFELF